MQTLKSRLETVALCFKNDFHGFRIKNSKTDTMKWLMRFNLPYLVREYSPGNYLLLNREYKPLGFMALSSGHDAEYANYNDHLLAGTPKLVNRDVCFYDDISVPWENAKCWKAYQETVLSFIEGLPD